MSELTLVNCQKVLKTLSRRREKIRYEFFDKYVPKDSKLLLAHHLDDDIEWNLMHQFKSSSPGKSSYIPKSRQAIFRAFFGDTKESNL